jgi:phosphoketolase
LKRLLLGHWGTTPGQNFIYAHLNRAIKQYDLDMIYVSGPGHGGPAVVGNTYLEGTYSEIYPDISQDETGLQKLFKQFSFPGGIPSHASRPGRSWPRLPVTLLASGAAVAMAVPAVHKHVHQRTGGE